MKLSYKDYGKGEPVVLLHGFPMNKEVWDDFAQKLSTEFHVITIDLPGFGQSESLDPGFTIEGVASEINSFLLSRKLTNLNLVGHSLGGYVALSIAKQNQSLIKKLVLFHSTAFPDSEEKKASRNKVLDFIDKQGVQTFTANFIAPLFYDQNHPAIAQLKSITIQAKQEIVKGYTIAMRDRPDMVPFLHEFQKPILFIGGEHDGGIVPETLKQQASLSSSFDVKILTEVAHMGMFEKPELSLQILKDFFNS